MDFFAVDFFLVGFLAADFFAVDFRAAGFFAAARAALAVALAWRAAVSASTSPSFVTLKSRSSSAPQPQHRSDLGRRSRRDPHCGTRMVLLRRVAHGAIAVGVAAAAVEHRAEPAPLLDQLTLLALRADDAGRDGRVLLDVLAVGVAAASGERTEPANALLQLLAAFGAELVEHLGLGTHAAVHVPDVLAVRVVRAADELAVAAELHLELARVPPLGGTERTFLVELLAEALEGVLGLLQGALERSVELVQHLDLAQVALGDVVELLLHVRGEA